MSNFFIAGITGRVGGAAARRLLDQGHGVRGYVRDPAAARAKVDARVELLRGDLADTDALAAAMHGTAGAFVMVPPMTAPSADFAEARALAASYRTALARAQPGRAVVLSSLGSEQTSGLGLITSTHILEQTLAAPGCPIAFVRAGGFLDNYVHAFAAARATGVFETFLVDTAKPQPVIASDDIGALVARELTSPGWTGRRVIELGSSATADDLARAMAAAAGRDVVARPIPRERWAAVIQTFGVPAGRTAAYEEMNEAIVGGRIALGAPDVDARVEATITPAAFFARLA
jgi:uncharacterized protein YbjT (DUF2867 family)